MARTRRRYFEISPGWAGAQVVGLQTEGWPLAPLTTTICFRALEAWFGQTVPSSGQFHYHKRPNAIPGLVHASGSAAIVTAAFKSVVESMAPGEAEFRPFAMRWPDDEPPPSSEYALACPRISNQRDGTAMPANNVTVGFIGLGTMGGRMAANLQRAGFRLIVHDLHRQAASHHLNAGATWADSPRALASAADVILTSLPEPADVESVAHGADGLLAGIRPDAAWFDLSTNAPSIVKALHAAVAEKGAHMLDAPVSGGPAGAASRKLAIWVGGDEGVFNRHRAVLDAIGDKPAYIGPIGSATVAKLVHNMSGYALVCALAETFAMGVKAGVEPLALWQAVRQGAAGRRFTFDALIDQFLPGKYDPPAFALKLAHKDVSLANALGRELGLPMRLCNLVLAEMTEALARGWGGRDSRSVMLLEQERAGIEIAVDPDRLRAALAPPEPKGEA